MASIKTKLLDNLQQKLHPKRGLIISGFGLCIAAASFILFSLIILITNKTTAPATSSLVSWNFPLPNTPLSSSNSTNSSLITAVNVNVSGIHFDSLDLKLKNVSFHGLESRVLINFSRNSENSNENEEGLRNNSGVLTKDCDIFDGKWVRDDDLPHYPPGVCPFVDRDFNCQLNGRPDTGYYRWKWQAFGCNIPR